MRSEEGPCRSVHANLHLPEVRSCDLLPTHWNFFSLWAKDTLDGNRRNVELVTALIEMFVHPLTAEHPNSRPRRKSATDRASPENQQERICSLSSRSFLPLRQQGEGKARKETKKKRKPYLSDAWESRRYSRKILFSILLIMLGFITKMKPKQFR